MNEIYIELHVPDFELAKEFYARLGFSVVWERTPEAHKGYLVMKRDRSIFCFWGGNKEIYTHDYFKKYSSDTPRSYGLEIVFPVADLDSYYEEVKAIVEVVEPFQLRPWGLKDFRIVDPFGYYIRITEPHNILDKGYAVP